MAITAGHTRLPSYPETHQWCRSAGGVAPTRRRRRVVYLWPIN